MSQMFRWFCCKHAMAGLHTWLCWHLLMHTPSRYCQVSSQIYERTLQYYEVEPSMQSRMTHAVLESIWALHVWFVLWSPLSHETSYLAHTTTPMLIYFNASQDQEPCANNCWTLLAWEGSTKDCRIQAFLWHAKEVNQTWLIKLAIPQHWHWWSKAVSGVEFMCMIFKLIHLGFKPQTVLNSRRQTSGLFSNTRKASTWMVFDTNLGYFVPVHQVQHNPAQRKKQHISD